MNMNIQPVTEKSYESEEEELDFVKLMMMENQPWWKVKCLPFDAVDQEQILKGRELDSPLIQVRYMLYNVYCLSLPVASSINKRRKL